MQHILKFIVCISVVMFFIGCSTAEKKQEPAQDAVEKQAQPETAEEKVYVLCLKCGEIKGTEKCCKAEGREKCGSCGMLKGAPGCCKIPEGATEAIICTKCGEIKGTEKCCKVEGREKCTCCGLIKGSVGCCKLDHEKSEE